MKGNFCLKKLPDIEPIEHAEIYQGYISTKPEVRVRSYRVLEGKNKGWYDYKLTVKSSGDLVREEIETYISEKFFEEVVQFIGKPFIHKDYRKYDVDGSIVECSVVDAGTDNEFCYAEVEFVTEDEAAKFEWMLGDAVDITYDKSYKMKNYWTRTRT